MDGQNINDADHGYHHEIQADFSYMRKKSAMQKAQDSGCGAGKNTGGREASQEDEKPFPCSVFPVFQEIMPVGKRAYEKGHTDVQDGIYNHSCSHNVRTPIQEPKEFDINLLNYT